MIAAGFEQPVQVDRLVGAMKIADADMDDAGREIAAGIGGLGDVRADGGQIVE